MRRSARGRGKGFKEPRKGIFGVISNREWALLIWLGVVLATFLLRSDLRSILLEVVRLPLNRAVVVPVALMAGWVGGMVVGAARMGGWDAGLVPDTTVFFFGTALVLMFSAVQGIGEQRFFRRTTLRVFRVAVVVEVFINLFAFSLVFELLLLPILVILSMLSVVAGSEQRCASVKVLIDTVVALIGFALFAYVLYQVVTDWQDFDRTGALRKFALPLWLATGIVPFVYLVGLYAAYDGAFKRIDNATEDGHRPWRAKLALALRLRVGIQDIAAFRFYWAKQAAAATSFRHATQAIDDFRAWRRAGQRAEAEAQDRLQRYAGVDGADDDGLRFDQREFKETKEALQALATAQMGWYRNQGNRYRPELVEILKSRFERSGLPPEHGISLWVADDGQSWWAYRRTLTGWCFAVGAAAPPPDQWLYDAPEPPAGPPGVDTTWGERWGLDAKNW